MLKEDFTLEERGDEYTLTQEVQQDVSDIIKQNYAESQSSNGFSDGRTMRKVMSMSHVDYLNGLKLGYGLDSEDPTVLKAELFRYLKERGRELGLQTVPYLLSPGTHSNIIIK